MTSSRLPGKVLLPAAGKPLLQWQLLRLKLCSGLVGVVVATTTNREDDPVADLAEGMGVRCFRGDEHDVLGRFRDCAETFGLEHVMRLTADCPLIDPQICDQLTGLYAESGADYVSTGVSFARGLDCEILPRFILERAWEEAELPSDREHVTRFVYTHPEAFAVQILESEENSRRYRITVDERADYLLVRAVIEGLAAQGKDPSVVDFACVKAFFGRSPRSDEPEPERR